MKTNIHLGNGFIFVEPDYPPSLLKSLTYWYRKLEWDPRSHTRITSGSYRSLYTVKTILDQSNRIINTLTTLPGFTRRIANTLQIEGYEIAYIDERTPFPKPDIDKAMEGLRDYQWEAAHNALVSGGGIISCPTAWGKTFLLKSIISAFDKDELIYRNTPLSVVVAASMDICYKNYNDLKKMFYKQREVGLVMTGFKEFSDDIQVITIDSLHHLNASEIGLFLYDECHEAATETRTDLILAADKALRWGFSATPFGRFDGSDLLSEGLFGPVVYQSSYAEGVKAGALVPIEVCWLRCPEPTIGLTCYAAYKRRNSKIDYGIELNKDLAKSVMTLITKIPDTLQTMCIVEHLKQMNELKMLNKDIKIVHGDVSEDNIKESRYHELYAVSKKERQEIYDQMANGTIRKILSTYVYKQGVSFNELAVIICPGGGGSAIVAGQIPGRASRTGVVGKDKAYIVDYIHDWDTYEVDGKKKPGPLLRDDLARKKVYKSLGFTQTDYNIIDELPFLKEINETR